MVKVKNTRKSAKKKSSLKELEEKILELEMRIAALERKTRDASIPEPINPNNPWKQNPWGGVKDPFYPYPMLEPTWIGDNPFYNPTTCKTK